MSAKKDTRIVECVVLLGLINGFFYALKFNPVNAFMNEVTAGISSLIAALVPGLSWLFLLILQILPAIILIVSVVYVFRLGGATAITAVAFGFGCGYLLLSDTLIAILFLAIGLLLGLYSVKSDKLNLKKYRKKI